MSWWLIPVFGVAGVAGLCFGWFVGTILAAVRDEPNDIWGDCED